VFGSFDSIARELLGTPSLVSFFRGKSGVWLLFHGKHRSPHRISLPLFSPSRADSGCNFLVCAGLRLGSSPTHFFLRSIMLPFPCLRSCFRPACVCIFSGDQRTPECRHGSLSCYSHFRPRGARQFSAVSVFARWFKLLFFL
jgi:hypothetical protein